MIKKLLMALAIMLPCTAFAQAKFAIVNTQEIITTMPEITEVNNTLQAASKQYEDEMKKLQDELQKAVEELDNLPADTPESIKTRREQSAQELYQRVMQFRDTAQQELSRQQETLMQPIQQKIVDAINAVGQEGGYTFIFENMVPVYVGTSVDNVTPLVKAKLGIK